MKIQKSVKQSFRKNGSSVFYDKKRLTEKLIIFASIILGTAFLYFSGIGCVWKYLFNLSCPGCGMTRAYIALLKLDITVAFRHHFMFPTVPIIFIYILFDKELLSKNFHKTVAVLIGIGFLINWLFKIL